MRILGIVAIAALVVSVTLKAAQDEVSRPAPPQQETAGQAGDMALQVGAPTETSGKIISLHTCQLVGMTDPHVLVKIKADDGETDIADLGTAADLKSNGFEPREGQQLWISGKVGRINDKFLIVAESLSESKIVTIFRTAPLREESEKHAAARGEEKNAASGKDVKAAKTESVDAGIQVRTVEGTVIHTRNFKFEGQTEEHVLAKLQTEGGIVVVDLGATATLPKVDLSAGKWIAVTGYIGHLNKKPIIVADAIGNLNSIERPEAKVIPTAVKDPASEK